LSMMNKSYIGFEEEFFRKNNPKGTLDESTIVPLKELTQQDLLNRLYYFEKELQSSPDTFPLYPNTPRVSDVLAWLNNHPQVVKKGEKEVSDQAQLQIENFSYSLVKRPELNKKQEKYQVKVEIEFSAPTPKQAREFHDALIAPNDFVDAKGEIKWTANRGKYRTSFFLKDKTSYLSTGGN
jgi:type IV pilus assembly protein PilM